MTAGLTGTIFRKLGLTGTQSNVASRGPICKQHLTSPGPNNHNKHSASRGPDEKGENGDEEKVSIGKEEGKRGRGGLGLECFAPLCLDYLTNADERLRCCCIEPSLRCPALLLSLRVRRGRAARRVLRPGKEGLGSHCKGRRGLGPIRLVLHQHYGPCHSR